MMIHMGAVTCSLSDQWVALTDVRYMDDDGIKVE